MTEADGVDAEALLERFNELLPDSATDSSDVRVPGHSFDVARERIASGRICAPSEHDWIELRSAYWRECRSCGLADVTVADLGQPVETPNVDD